MNNDRLKVLFVGNSHTYFNDMPELFSRMCRAGADLNAEPVMLSHPSRTLEWHLREYYELRFNLLYGHYDYCIIQQAAHPFPGKEETLRDIARIEELCRKGRTQPVIVETWAEKRAPEHQAIMNETYHEAADEHDSLLAPVGEVWQSMILRHPETELYWKDGEHASPYGDYLIACVLYRVITGNEASGLPDVGIDFLKGLEAGPDAGFAIEDKSELLESLDPESCRQIRHETDRICRGL